MVSSSASKKLWPRMRAFWAARDVAPDARRTLQEIERT
jgi:hypothetical protein